MTAKKRVFDKDLGVELVLDDETDEELANSRRTDDQLDDRGRKRAKIEISSQSNSNQRSSSSQQQQQNSSFPNQSEPHGQDEDSPRSSYEENSDNENYEGIDYGDDDYSDDINNLHPHQSQSDDLRSLNDDDMNAISSPFTRHEKDGEDENRGISDRIGEGGSHQESGRSGEVGVQHDDDGEEEDDDDEGNRGEQGEDRDGDKEQPEKCKYWPACNAGDDCSYYHPTKPCKMFPNCRFGQKCLFIHPKCKFIPNCTRPGCPFSHPAMPVRRPPNTFRSAQQPLAPRCKFGLNCMNLMCKFSHQRPEPCRFGSHCLLESCAFTHPSEVSKKKNPSAFKWSAQS